MNFVYPVQMGEHRFCGTSRRNSVTWIESLNMGQFERGIEFLPLPEGEGRGEGEARSMRIYRQVPQTHHPE